MAGPLSWGDARKISNELKNPETNAERVGFADPPERLALSLFCAIGLPGARVQSRGRRLICGRVSFVAGDRPPAILISGQLAHLRAMFRAGLVRAMAVTERRRRPGSQDRRLVGEGSRRDGGQQDC